MKITTKNFCAAIMLSATVTMTAAAGADETAKPGAVAAPATVNASELKAFAKVYVEYQAIRQSYEPKLGAMKDEKEKQKVQSEATEKIKHALEKQGLTAQAYNRIFAAVNGDPQLRQKALALINQERRKS